MSVKRNSALCAVIPVYNHEHAIGLTVQAVLKQGLPCILVDDGSHAACAKALDEVVSHYKDNGQASVHLVRHRVNGGKGQAMMTGFQAAAAQGYSHVLQIDADGQHDAEDIPRFLALSQDNPQALICGCPVYDESVPKGRLYGRYATHIWVWINTLSLDIADSMCGFRVYPLAPVISLLEQETLGTRMNFDPEVLVRLHWRGVSIINLPTHVSYPVDGVSHFRIWADNVGISLMHTRLFFGMLWRLPHLLSRRLSRKTAQDLCP